MAKTEVKVYFCRLDAKDDPYTGYEPVSFAQERGQIGLSKEAEKLQIWLRREYLTKLKRLQDELARQYETEYANINVHTPADAEPWGQALSKKEYEKTRQLAERHHPGDEADYYT